MNKTVLFKALFLVFLLVAMVGTAFVVPVAAVPTVHNTDTGFSYDTIQEAIDANETLGGHTIQVDAGIYYEHLFVSKSLTIVGEGSTTTIIDGGGSGNVVLINTSNVEIRGFTVQNSGQFMERGVIVNRRASNSTVRDCLIRNNAYGLVLTGSNRSSILGNMLVNNSEAGLEIRESSNNTLRENTVMNNPIGVQITSALSLNNTFHLNNFVDNPFQAIDFGSGTSWDNGYPSGGNYWNDYTGDDFYTGPYQNETGSDGIGDTPYIIATVTDNYPFTSLVDIEDPVADAGPDQSVYQGMTVTFNGGGSYDDVGIQSYLWTFTDETPKNLTGVTPTYRFKNVGNFTVTLKVTDYSGKLDTDTLWVNIAADNTKPTIGTPVQEPVEPGDGESVTISVNVTDEESGVSNVTLSYSTNGGTTWNNVTMINSTGDTFMGEIPGFSNGTEVWYNIVAFDNAENVEVDDKGGQYYDYTVIPEFPLATLLLLFILATLIATLLKKKCKLTFQS